MVSLTLVVGLLELLLWPWVDDARSALLPDPGTLLLPWDWFAVVLSFWLEFLDDLRF